VDHAPFPDISAQAGIASIQDGELVTPQNIRLRKRVLDPPERKKASRKEG
jgi:predicted membrane GTPase involved in stress response